MKTMTQVPVAFNRVYKSYGGTTALDGVTLEIPDGRVVGLLGRNGAGKTTLLNVAAGLVVPDGGEVQTLGMRSERLDTEQLSRLGVVQQEGRFVEWMTVAQHLDFTRSFYASWDRELETRLVKDLELGLKKRVAELSTGDRQKLGILLGVCHRPSLLLLDEPMSSLDPIARRRMLDLLIELLRDNQSTVVVSSHLLADVEKVADWIVFLSAGKVVENAALDDLQERYAEWTLETPDGGLPSTHSERWVLRAEGGGRRLRLWVRVQEAPEVEAFAQRWQASGRSRALSLEELFPLLTEARRG